MNDSVTFLIVILLFVLSIIFILYSTFKDRVKTPFLPRVFLAILLFAIIAFSSALLFRFLPDSRLLQTGVLTVTTLVEMLILYLAVDYKLTQCVFIACVVKCYADNILLLTSLAYYTVVGMFPAISTTYSVWSMFLIIMATLPLIFFFFKRLMRPALDLSGSLPFWSYIWIVPLCNNILYSLYIGPVLTTDDNLSPGRELYLLPFLWILLSFSTYVIMLRMIIGLSSNARLQEELHITDIQIAAQQKQLEYLQQHIRDTRRMRHDIRHHILALQGFITKNDYAGMSDYVRELLSGLEEFPSESYCGNTAIDALLGYYSQEAEENHIRISISAALSDIMPASDTDLCIILGNLLENALEACKRQKSPEPYIRVQIFMPTDATLVIVVENSHDQEIRKKDNLFLSSKEKNRKGIGISSVLDVAKSYRGIPNFEYDKEHFKVSLLLHKKSQKEKA